MKWWSPALRWVWGCVFPSLAAGASSRNLELALMSGTVHEISIKKSRSSIFLLHSRNCKISTQNSSCAKIATAFPKVIRHRFLSHPLSIFKCIAHWKRRLDVFCHVFWVMDMWKYNKVMWCVISRAGKGGVKVREFVYNFCAYPPKPRQRGRRNQQNFTSPNAENPTSDHDREWHKMTGVLLPELKMVLSI